MARRLIGIGITDAQGNVAIPYTGTGAGKLQIVAECGDLTSDTYELSDYLFYDSGFESVTSLASKWSIGDKITRSSDDNGTKIEAANATVSTCYQYTNTTFTGDFEATFHFETIDGTIGTRFGIVSGSTRRYATGNAGNRYMKLQRINGVTTIYYSSDNENWSESSMTGTEPSGAVSIMIGMYNTLSTPTSFIYKDLKVYYI